MACSMSSSVGLGSCSCPAARLRRVSSVSSFRCGSEQLESGIAPPHVAIHSSEDVNRRWRASSVSVQTQVVKDKAACERREGFGVSRRSLLGLLAVALPPAVALLPAVAFAEEEEENDSQKLFRQLKTSVVEKVEKQEREKAVVAAAAPPPSAAQEPVPAADTSPEPEPEPQPEPELTAVQEPEPLETYAASSEETPQPEEETPSPSVVAGSEEPLSSSESSEISATPISDADPIVPPTTPETEGSTGQQLEATPTPVTEAVTADTPAPSPVESTPSVIEAVTSDIPAPSPVESTPSVIEAVTSDIPAPSPVESTLTSVTEAVTPDILAPVKEAEGNVPVFVPFLGIAGTALVTAIHSVLGQPKASSVNSPSEAISKEEDKTNAN